MADPDLVTDLVYAQNSGLAVEVTLHEGERFPEPVGVAELSAEHGWAEFYVADSLGADVLMRLPLDAIAWVEVTEYAWRTGPAPASP